MATGTIVLQSICAGGEHATVRLTVGAQNFDFTYGVGELDDPITAADRREAVKTIVRFHCGGMTAAQTRTELQSPGISVVTS